MTVLAGDIAFVGINSFNPDQFAILAVNAITAGDIFYVTDGGYTGTMTGVVNTTFRATEGFLQYTAPAGGIAAGSVLVITGGDGVPANASVSRNGGGAAGTVTLLTNGTASTNTAFTFSASGDQLTAYTVSSGTYLTGNPVLIAFIDIATNPYGAGSASLSSIPTISGGQVLDLINVDNAIFTNAANVSSQNIAALSNASNFSTRETTVYDLTTLASGSTVTPATISINDVSITEGNSGTSTLTFTVTRSNNSGAFSVDYATADQTAIAGSDYTATSGTLTFAANGGLTQTVSVTINGDTTVESNESFAINLSNIVNTTGTASITDNQGIGTITSDDFAVPTVNLSVSSTDGTEAGTTSITVTATATSAVSRNQTVNLGVTGTGITTGDYNLSNSVIEIANGQTTGSVTFTVVNDADVEGTETATLTISNPSAGISLGTTTTQNIAITDNDVAITKISAIQGTGTAATAGTFTIEGIVVGDFQGANQLGGFYLQEEDTDADGNVSTSEAIFVNSLTAVNVGDRVQVTGTVQEDNLTPSFNQAVITPTSVSVLATGQQALVTATVLDLPTTVLGDLERYEGMLVTIPETLTVTEVFNLGRFGEVSLSANGRLPNPTNIIDPNDSNASGTSSTGTSNVAAVTAQQDLNNRSRIILDDGSSASNLSDVPYVNTTDGDLTNDTLRIGSTIAGLTGVVGYGFNNYRIQATQAPVINYEARPTLPTVGGSVKVGSFNVLNYFNGDGLGGGFPTSRGADSAAEFSRQRAKIIAAIQALNADVVGLIEMENDGDGANSAIADLVNGLNTAMGAGTYAFTPLANTTGSAGTDQIKVAFIYKPSTVTPVGNAPSKVFVLRDIGVAVVAHNPDLQLIATTLRRESSLQKRNRVIHRLHRLQNAR